MLGEQIAELVGNITSQRILDIDNTSPKIEATVSLYGKMNNVDVKSIITYWNIRKPDGSLYGEGRGIITTNEGDMATSRAQGMGKLDKDGVARWLGSVFYTSTPTGKLTFLDNLIGVFDTEVSADGHVLEKVWQWK
ncbi:MAG TPA: hypothetical protein VH415_09405 [Nitrososphaeraceae archaeon]|jgi:hypothetical protein